MKKYHLKGESIECNAADVKSRDIRYQSAREYKSHGVFFKYKCSIDSYAEIEEELAPKECRICENSKLDQGDTLHSDSLVVYNKIFKPAKKSIIEFSGSHRAQNIKLKNFTFAQITIPMDRIINAIESRSDTLEDTPIPKLQSKQKKSKHKPI